MGWAKERECALDDEVLDQGKRWGGVGGGGEALFEDAADFVVGRGN
jgi:hypothetical protein